MTRLPQALFDPRSRGSAVLVHHLLAHVTTILAAGSGVVPDPNPVSPVSSSGVNLLLGYAKWGSLIACGTSALISGGMLAVGHLSHRPDVADQGKKALVWSLIGVAVVALAIPTLNTIFGSVNPSP
jgi:hypothetical protein